MMQESFSDAALVLLGHGSTKNADSGTAVFQQAAELRRRRLFAEVREGFWKQEPRVMDVLPQLTQPRLFIAPLFISEGYFSEKAIPEALGFHTQTGGSKGRVQKQGAQRRFYCRPVGSHPSMAGVLVARAKEVLEKFPFPRAPKCGEVTLFIAGHGTEQNENSRRAVEQQAERIGAKSTFAAVQAIFLEEEPRIDACYTLAQTKYLVVVPFFISDGLHVQEDIPVMLGEPERVVQQRLAQGQPTWRNPTEKHGKLVWFASGIGSERLLADVVLERVREAAEWARGCS